MKSINWKKYLPEAGIIALFLIAACVYFSPVLGGKIICGSDNIQATAAVHESVEFSKATGETTWWNSSMFCGMPNYQLGGGKYAVSTILRPFQRFFQWGHRNSLMILFFYLVAFYILMRAFGVERLTSVAGSFAVSLSSYFMIIIAATHNTKCTSITWMTLVLVGMILIFKKKYGWGSFLTMFFMIMGFTPHPQMSYYMFMLMGVLACAEIYIHIKEKRYKDLGIAAAVFAVSLAIGMGACSANVFANKEYVTETMRGGHSELSSGGDAGSEVDRQNGLDLGYATAWSYGVDETFTLLIPNFMGAASGYNVGTDSVLFNDLVKAGVPRASAKEFCEMAPTYRGTQPFTAGPVYAGAIICFLFVLGLFITKGPYKWALIAATIFSVLLSWGSNFMPFTRLFFNHFPLYNKFRTVSSILIVAEITIPLLGFLAVKAVACKEAAKEKILHGIYWAAGITGGICLVFALLGGSLINFTAPGDAQFSGEWWYGSLIAQRQQMLTADAWRSLLFIALAALLVWLYAKDKIKTTVFGAILTVLVVADMWPVDRRFCNDSVFTSKTVMAKAFPEQNWEKILAQDPDPNFRVLNVAANTFNDAVTSYRFKSLGGYFSAKLRRYQDLIDRHISKMTPGVLNMLNCKYYIIPQGNDAVPQLNPGALGNAWFVKELQTVSTPDQECDALYTIDPATTAVVDITKFGSFAEQFAPATDSTATISLTASQPNKLEYVSNSATDGLAVFSEVYYPYGWKASIDGTPAEHFRVDYVLRAMYIPAGEHQIQFVFDPDSIRKGNALSLASLGAMVLVIAFFIARGIRGRKKETAEA